MSTKSTGLLERLRQPEYVGENRCTPCTIVNIVIAAGVSAVVSRSFRRVGGVVVFGLALAIIYLRGYLVPGTPTFTKRYFPDWVLARFDKLEDQRPVTNEMVGDRTAEDRTSEDETVEDEREPEEVLAEAGVVEPCEEVDDLCLTDSFEATWHDEIETIEDGGTEKSDLSAVLDVDEEKLSFEEYDEAMVAEYDDGRLGQWESRAALLADLAAAKVLEDRYDDWDALTVTNQSRVLSGLRIFLDTCPECGSDVTMEQDTVESCCRTMDVVALSCQECDSRLLEVQHDQ